jgi:polyphenol oxidase
MLAALPSAAVSVLLRSTVLEREGFAHGFSLRTGGVSEGAYASLNLARTSGDLLSNVEENRRRFARDVGYAPDALFEVSQVHGAVVRVVAATEVPDHVRRDEADALVVAGAGRAAGVRVADCIALLLGDPRSGAVAAVHAGWRGVASGIAPRALAALTEHHAARAEDVIAAIGPHIRACCFEVGDEVAAEIAEAVPNTDVVRRQPSRSKPHVDLVTALRAQLSAAGVRTIDDPGGCTRCDADRFFSFRRDGAASGRHVGAIVAR